MRERTEISSNAPANTGFDTADERPLTKAEASVIRRLKSIERDWPDTLVLFDWSGTLHVFDRAMYDAAHEADRGHSAASIATFGGISSGGGDPNG